MLDLDPKSIRREFYNRLADAARVPRRHRMPRTGLPVPLADGRKGAVRAYAYNGSFNNPDKYGLPVPRIVVRLAGPWSGPDLELTLTLDELHAWAPWIVAWIRAKTDDGPPLPPAPTPLTCPWRCADLREASYLWTVAGKRVAQGYGRCPHCGAPSACVPFAGPPAGPRERSTSQRIAPVIRILSFRAIFGPAALPATDLASRAGRPDTRRTALLAGRSARVGPAGGPTIPV